MKVSGFMVPADKVITCMPNDTIRYVSELLLKHNIGAVVVMKEAKFPVGLVTKTDILKAYKENLTLDHTAEDIMSRELEACEEHTSRDQAARIMERNKNHHALVMNKNADFVGLVSSWDITVECARDDRAWPWNRPEDGRFHSKKEQQEQETMMATSPTTPADEAHIANVQGGQRQSHLGDSFRDYVDHLGLVDM